MPVENLAGGRRATAKRLLCTSIAAMAAGATPAAAQTSITTGVTTPTATATAASGAPSDVSVAATGSIIVTSGIAATINSNNLLTNLGTIGNSATSTAVGVRIDGTNGLSNANLVNSGIISLTGTGGSGNIGLLVNGGPITGSISTTAAGTISVLGDGAIGASIAAPFTGSIGLRSITVQGTGSTVLSITAPVAGSVSLAGTSANNGGGGYGILVSAPISGRLTNAGALSVGTSTSLNATGTAKVAGLIGNAGVRISANVGQGFLNDRYYVDAASVVVPTASVDTKVDTLVTGSIITAGTAPAIWIAPDATNPQAISLGAVGTGADAFALNNRGIVRAVSGNTGLATTAILIGGGGATTTLAGGITSSVNGLISSSSTDANTAAIRLSAGAIVPQIANLGSIDATVIQTAAAGSTPAGPGGNAIAIAIDSGVSIASITNAGSIGATAVGTGKNATAILDQSGTLGSITNSGTLGAVSSGGGTARAINLTGSNVAFTLVNTGTIIGDVILGNGITSVQLGAGSISGALAFGTGANSLSMAGTTVFSGTLTSGAPLAISLADTAKLSLINGPGTIASLNAGNASIIVIPTRGAAPGLTVSGAANFTGTSSVSLSLQSLTQSQSVTVISAAGGITTDHAGSLIDASVSPYLFTASNPTLTATTLSIDLTRKSAADIGLAGGQAALYNQSLKAFTDGGVAAVAIANLPNQASVVAAYRQLTPPSFGHAAVRAAESFADTGYGAANERLASVAATRDRKTGDTGVWVQEIGDFASQKAGVQESAFKTSTFGIAGGIDRPLLGLDAVGIAVLSNWASVKQSYGAGLGTAPLQISSVGIAPYASWSWKSIFVQATALAAKVSYSSTRNVTIGSLSSTIGANWKGTQFGAGATIGANLRLGNFRIVPTNSVYWTRLHQNGYSEIGGGEFNLGVNSQTDTLFTDTARLSVSYLVPFGEGDLLAEAHAAYTHQFSATNAPTVAHFLSGGDSITMPQDDQDAKKFGYGGAVGYIQGPVKFLLGYDRRQNSSYKDQQAALTATMSF
jgi:uncharacterized protein with beta-barrel porin domain